MTDATLTRSAKTGRNIMTENPVSIHEHATLQEAADFLTKRHISAAPVINGAGRAVGVLSRTDIVRFSRGALDVPQPLGDFVNEALDLDDHAANLITVSQVMTPVVLSIELDASLAEVCDKMLDREVHRLFVIDQDETLVGVISALDVLGCLRRGGANARVVTASEERRVNAVSPSRRGDERNGHEESEPSQFSEDNRE